MKHIYRKSIFFPIFIIFVLLQLEEAAERDRRPFGTQLFPFRTVAMILSLIAIPLISQLMVYLFNSNTLKKDQDYFMCIVNIPDDEAQVSHYFFIT